jgi:DNA-binding NarL/FixJ family response regulator
MDLRLRGGVDGIEATRRLLAVHAGLRVLALSTHDDPVMVRGWRAIGGCGYMLKGDPLPELVHALREAAAGRAVYSASLPTGGTAP